VSKIAVITGAATGIGRATLEAFAAAGWEAIGLDRQPAEELPAGARIEQVDVSAPEQVETFFARLRMRHPQLHALVNNPSIPLEKPLVEITPEEWEAVQAINLRSVFLTSRSAFPLLKAAKGAIVNLSSSHAIPTSIHVAAYAASRGGVLALTRAMALEFGTEGVRVNVAQGRVDRPEEIARAILFLADERRASFITGQALVVDGWAGARLSTQ
jgi:NAD(P)-dependent dehydrogenase (short-subunit alcohol dehydrogenase family)